MSKVVKKGWKARLKEVLIIFFFVIVTGWGVDVWRSQSTPAGQVPALPVQTLQGESVDLIQLSQTQPVLLYFWATWCTVCQYVSPSVNYMDGDYTVLSVAISSGNEARVKSYLQAKQYNFATINDPSGVISKQWGVRATPTLFVINKGEISAMTTGFTSPLGIWLRLL